MATTRTIAPVQGSLQWPVAFAAGFIAVLALHQPMLGLLSSAGITQAVPYATRAVGPLGVPQFVSAAFWGGLWGIVLHATSRRWPVNGAFLLKTLVFGMICPTFVAWFIVAPIKGLPMAGGFKANSMLTGLCVNAAWGLGAGLLLALYRRSAR
ncbi:MAG: hypothetical protein ABWY05_00555 [Noviherbaspirillum sp.]